MFVKIVDGAVNRASKLIDHGDRQQAVASEIEEIIAADDASVSQVLCPNLCDARWSKCSSLLCAAARLVPRSSAIRARAARSTLPAVLTGMAEIVSTADGNMYDGRLFDRWACHSMAVGSAAPERRHTKAHKICVPSPRVCTTAAP
jgi:hypothetical protein